MDLIATSLGKLHDRKSFDCGESSLNQYLNHYANQDIRRRIYRVFVASLPDASSKVIGYYSLSAGSLTATDLHERLQRQLPKHPTPVVLLGRLAIAKSHQGKGLGSVLLANALRRIAQASQVMEVYTVVVDALNDRAAEFYRQFGFIPLPNQPHKLFLPMSTAATLVE